MRLYILYTMYNSDKIKTDSNFLYTRWEQWNKYNKHISTNIIIIFHKKIIWNKTEKKKLYHMSDHKIYEI
jgi:hypothetical protein